MIYLINICDRLVMFIGVATIFSGAASLFSYLWSECAAAGAPTIRWRRLSVLWLVGAFLLGALLVVLPRREDFPPQCPPASR